MTIKINLNCLFFVLFQFIVISLDAQTFYITETLRNNAAPTFTFGGDPKAYLTSGVEDSVGDGWLRLTKDLRYQKGYAIVNQSFPSTLGVQVDLEFKIWRINLKGVGADGFSVFLFDATTDPFIIGGFGGSLGYAQFDNVGANKSSGLSGGYVGIGLDEFGNYSKEFEGRIGGEGFHKNSIGVRGPTPTFSWLKGNFDLGFMLEYGQATERPSDSVYYRRIQIEIIPISGSFGHHYKIKVRIKTENSKRFYDVLSYELPSVPPSMLKLGFAASTGDCINFHEVRNLQITTPGGVRVIKSVDKTVADVGEELTYTVELFNQSDTLVSSGLFLNDLIDLPSSKFQITSVKFENNDYSGNNATGYSDSVFSRISMTMEPSSQATFIVKGKIKGYPQNGTITNTAIFNVGSTGIIDHDTKNDTSSVTTMVNDLGLCAIDDSAKAIHGIPVNIPVLDNDLESRTPIDRSSVSIVDLPRHGEASPKGDGTVDYTAEDGYFGDDLFTYKVKDGTDTWDTATVFIVVRPNIFFIPNIFTPNGDNINDCFVIPGLIDYPKSRLKILNRWGNEVYFNLDYQNDWDGYGLNEGTYFYSLVLLNGGKEIVYKGWVLLKR